MKVVQVSLLWCLGRTVVYEDDCLTWEADPRHAELAIAELVAELAIAELGLEHAKPHTAPGCSQAAFGASDVLLDPEGQAAYRRVSQRLSYLGADRPDIAYACRQRAKTTGKADRSDLTGLKRNGRYLKMAPICIWRYELQSTPKKIVWDM